MSSVAGIGDGSRTGIGDAADRPRRLGAAPARLARLRRRSVLRSHRGRTSCVPGQADAAARHPQRRWSCCCRTSTCRSSSAPRRRRRPKFFYSGPGDDLNTTMTRRRRRRWRADRQGALLHRGGLRLRVPRGLHRRRRHLDPVATNLSAPAGDDQSGFNGSGRHHRARRRRVGRPDGHRARRHQRAPVAATRPTAAWRESGFQVDNIALGGTVIGDAETDDEGWTFDGFRGHDRHRGPVVPQRLHRGQPPVRRARHAAPDTSTTSGS